MKAFEFDHRLIDSYARFSRSFSTVRSDDLKSEIDRQYDAGRFWPNALLSLNPRYLQGPTVDDLVASGDLDEATGSIFRFEAEPVRFHRHQAQSIAKARAGQSYVVTTGTGSGKSLCFFVPVVDAIIRARKAGRARRTSAIIVYPMNALANSQINEIEKFISQSGLLAELKPLVRRYTGQESQEERRRIANDPPDILLTNFMMAELLLTRQDAVDTKVIENASGLDFIVLDELHTYRGRQGADVAILVRRLRNRCTPDKAPICIGTSATMASEGSDTNRAQAVADVASRLFGVSIGPESVIDESLQRATDDLLRLDDVRPKLASVLTSAFPEVLTDEVLKEHPLAVWIELAIGLDDRQELKRKKPIAFAEAVALLSQDSGVEAETCRSSLETFLTRISLPETERGGSGTGAFLAFKLHQFISGAGEIFTTLTEKPRNVLFEGQLEDPSAPSHRLYPTRFCRECGHEVHVVTRTDDANGILFLPRNIDDAPLDDQEGDTAGYLTSTGDDDPEYAFTGEIETYPEDWREERNGVERLRANRKHRVPQMITVAPDGRYDSSGKSFWFIPGKFGFCPCCLDQPHPSMRERTKLAGLSGEGRSSATTLLVSTALEWMNGRNSGVPRDKRKLLGFTDNRQDAALQAGHFNDFLFVSLLRGAILRAVLDVGDDGMAEDEFGLRVVKALGFTAGNKDARIHWMLDPDAGAVVREDAQRSLAKVLAHRLWTDLRRGWRYTNPSLSVLKLIDVAFVGLDDIVEDTERFTAILPDFGALDVRARKAMLKLLLGAMVDGLAVGTEALDLTVLDTVAQKSRNLLRAPWAIDAKETPRSRTTLFLQAPGRDRVGLREEQTIIRAGHNSRIGRLINRRSVVGTKLGKSDYLTAITGLMELLAHEGLVSRVDIEADLQGWRLSPSAVRIIPGEAIRTATPQGNRYFHDLYNAIANDLKEGNSTYWGLEGREHTAQVSQRQREWREWRFRFEKEDRENLSENVADLKAAGESEQFLPALFCSPTMELGVDISALNAVYLRNVPPTPANYAQRAGRAGRSGQAAVIVSYCAAQSPHDQYFFERRNEMVAGVVRPPALDITNEELVRSHLHAVWLAAAKLALSPDIPEILDLTQTGYPLKQEIRDTIDRPELPIAAHPPLKRVLDQILASVDDRKPVWMGDPDAFVSTVSQRAPLEFDRAFDRWRELYNSARTQLMEANARSEITGLSGADRRRIKAAQMQASDQITILEQGKASNGSDFYSYRYLATEGFLPGYNFPRLPLYAFIPGEGKAGSFLQRARFLAISEFGPRSLIYHEGRAYRVLNPSVEATRRFVRDFLKETFGFDDLAPHDDVVSFIGGGRAPVVVVPPAEDRLDRRSPTLSTDRSRSPAFALQDYLNDNDSVLWGLVTNGVLIRLMRDNASLTRPAYIEADLAQIFTNEDAASFAILWLLIHRSRFGAEGAPVTECALERWREAGSREGEAARDRLADQVQLALEVLGSGFLEANPDLAAKLKSGGVNLTEWFNELLRLVYRLIFLMVAEDRNLLHPETARSGARKLYAEGYSLAALREQCARAAAWDRHHDRYEGVKVVFRALARGEEALGLPALGGLFGASMLPHLETARLRNRAFMQALYRLSWLTVKNGVVRVNWRAMETEELGSVYESLLELQPQLGDDGKTLVFASEAAEQKGNQRKTTGSYYTPDSLVELLLDTTLDPVLNERETQASDPAEELLRLSVIDPACGSGHFLLAAARRIATRVARYRAGGIPSAADFRHALREVACRCLYGVDRNPMAVELTKVALWIEALEPGRPLAFFDAQIRCGDSLIGVFSRGMLREGLPDEAYKPLTGDDKELSRRYARLNKEQRDRAKGHPQLFKNWSPPEILAERDHKLKEMAQDDLVGVEAKARGFTAIRASDDWRRLKTASDLYISANFYMAAFFTPKAAGPASTDAMPLTEHVWQAAGGQAPAEHLRQGATLTSEKVSAFHWFIEFPEIMERDGGFDVVIGNPPWERIKLSEQEFFATRSPAIASAANKTERQKLIEILEEADPDSADGRLWQDFVFAKRAAEAASEFVRSSGRYPLTGRGDVNTYALFAELFSHLAKPSGRAGVIVPTGIATDSSTSEFFGYLITRNKLRSLFSFYEIRGWFKGTDDRKSFCILGLGGRSKAAEFCFDIKNIAEIDHPERRFELTEGEIARINPNTKTAPVFRSRADATLAAKLYTRAPVLIQERPREVGGDINPWGITFQTMFHMSSDSGFFRTPAQMEPDGWRREGVDWVRETATGAERRVPLYEAKMIHHFDHRFGSFFGLAERPADGALPEVPPSKKLDADFEPDPWYWVPEDEVILRAARVPTALKSAMRLAMSESGKGRRKADVDPQEGARAAALKTLVTWLAGAISALEGHLVREGDIFRLLGRVQDWRGALKASPERFLLDPKTLAAGAEMQRETPLTTDDLSRIAEGPKDAFALAEVLIAAKQPRYLMGWRDITNNSAERTVVGGTFPKVGVGNNLPIWYVGQHVEGKYAAAFVGMLSCLTFDFAARHKVGGTHLNFFIAQQLPVLPPSAFTSDDLAFIASRVLELTYTSHTMKAWAEDLGYSGPPFAWNEERRARLRAELDVFFARKYGLTEEEQRYVLDPADVKGSDYPSETFRVLKEKEIRQHGEYRTRRLVLAAWDRMEADGTFAELGLADASARRAAQPIQLPSLDQVPHGVWAWAQGVDERDRIRTQLRAIAGILPNGADARRARLATLACLNPSLLTGFLSAPDRAEWQRIVGPQARPIEGVATLTPPTNAAWGAAYNELVSAAVLNVSADGSEWSAGPRLDTSTLHVDDPAVGRALFAWSRVQSVDLDQGLIRLSAEIIPFIREGHLAA